MIIVATNPRGKQSVQRHNQRVGFFLIQDRLPIRNCRDVFRKAGILPLPIDFVAGSSIRFFEPHVVRCRIVYREKVIEIHYHHAVRDLRILVILVKGRPVVKDSKHIAGHVRQKRLIVKPGIQKADFKGISYVQIAQLPPALWKPEFRSDNPA